MEWLFSWEVTSWVVGVLVATAFAVLALDDFKLAKTFFLLAAADAAGGLVMWGTKSALPPWLTSLIVFIAVGAVGLGALQSLRYVDRKKGAKEQKKTEEPFTLEINGLAVGHDSRTGPEVSEAVVYASLYNNGPPSIADHWSLTIQPPEKSPVKGTPREFDPAKPFVAQDTTGEIIKIDPTDALYLKTESLIPTGMREVGALLFDIPLPFAESNTKGTIYTLECRDTKGTKVSAKWEKGSGNKAKKGEYPHLRGMKPVPE